MKRPATSPNDRLRNVLLSVGLCVALFAAYYMVLGNEKIPPDTHVSFEAADCRGGCPLFQIDLMGDGQVTLIDTAGRTLKYRVSKVAVAHMLRVFRRQRFFERDIRAYDPAGARLICVLTLKENHQKSAIRHICGAKAPEIASSLLALDHATRFSAVLRHDPMALSELHVETAPAH